MIAELLGNCQLTLKHNGRVEIPNLVTNNLNLSTGGALYAKATATWVRGAGHTSTVQAAPASDPIGTLTGDPTITIILPRAVSHKDPNVYTNDILQYVEVNGLYYAVGEGYLDDKIGTLRPMTIASAINGWLAMDGAGATTDLRNKFVRGGSTFGTPGGSDTHTHTGEAADESLSVGGTIDSATTGITIDDHPDHIHAQRDTVYEVDAHHDPGAVNYNIWSSLKCGSGMKLPGEPDPCENASDLNGYTHHVNDAGHTHTVASMSITPNPHSHDVSIDAGSNVPAYIEVVWYVRTGPSGEIT
jgi:hypothetical protein